MFDFLSSERFYVVLVVAPGVPYICFIFPPQIGTVETKISGSPKLKM
jgi:hypothetical protein